ncbi:MAG: NAD(P)/FAD-dependent oxidoreductase [Candidatus Sulfotelmatobacter sp.]
MPSSRSFPVVIIGGGPAGSCTAMFLKQLGIESIIIEKERFPRYHIGESFTGETGGQMRKLGMAELLDRTAKEFPVKHGTKVYGTGGKNSFYIPVRDRLGPNNSQRPATTWQARRSVFDKLLLDTAVERGVEIFNGEAVSVLREGDTVTGVRCRSVEGAEQDLMAEVVVDASGQTTFLANRGVIGPKDRGNYDKQVGIFSQVTGAVRDEGELRDNTLIFYEKKNHWAWFIPLDPEVVSIGIVTPSDYFVSRKLSKEEFVKAELQTLNPELTRRVQDVQFVEEARAISNYSYQIRDFTGKGFLCVGDSHRFIDPIFSLGLLFATKEAQYAAEAIRDYRAGKNRDAENPFAEYADYVEKGQDVIQAMLDCFWEWPFAFQRFAHHTHQEEIVDLFAGRIYGPEVHEYDSVQRMRRLLAMKQPAQPGEMVSAQAQSVTDRPSITN